MRTVCCCFLAASIVGVLTSCAPFPSPAGALETVPEQQFVSVEWAPAATAAASDATKLYVAPGTDQPPKLDGVLDDPCWKAAPVLTGLTMEGKPADVQMQTNFVFDEARLYVGFKCDEPNMAGLAAACKTRDGNVWYDDCVELWLDINYDRRRSYHFLFNPIGTVLDLRERDEEVGDLAARRAGSKKVVHHQDEKWNSGCTAKTAKGKDFWTVEVAIPVGPMGSDEIIRGSRWGLNVARARRSGGTCALSTWTGVFVSPISRFGTLQFDRSDCDFGVVSLGNLSVGKNFLVLRVKNLTKAAKRIDVHVSATAAQTTHQHTQVALAVGETKDTRVPYTLHGVGSRFALALHARDAETKERILSRRYEGIVPDVLNLKLNTPQLYLGEQNEVKGHLVVNLGDAELPNSSISLELVDDNGRVIAADAIAGLKSEAVMTLNIANLKEEGDYRLRARVLDRSKRCLAQKEVPFNLIEPPF